MCLTNARFYGSLSPCQSKTPRSYEDQCKHIRSSYSRLNYFVVLLLFDDVDRLPRLKVAGVNDDRLADAHAGEDFRPGVGASARGDGLLSGLAVLDRDDLLDACEGDDGARGHGDRRVAAVGDDLGVGEAAGSKRAGVTDLGLDDEHAVLLVDGRTQAHDAARVEPCVALDGDAHGLARVDARRLALWNLAAEAKGVDANDRQNGRARSEVFADARALLLHDAVEGRDDGRVGERLTSDG